LTLQRWSRRSEGIGAAGRVDQYVDGEAHIVVTNPDGEIVSISGPAGVLALVALANDALPARDPRKITRDVVQLLESLTAVTWAEHRAWSSEKHSISLPAR